MTKSANNPLLASSVSHLINLPASLQTLLDGDTRPTLEQQTCASQLAVSAEDTLTDILSAVALLGEWLAVRQISDDERLVMGILIQHLALEAKAIHILGLDAAYLAQGNGNPPQSPAPAQNARAREGYHKTCPNSHCGKTGGSHE